MIFVLITLCSLSMYPHLLILLNKTLSKVSLLISIAWNISTAVVDDVWVMRIRRTLEYNSEYTVSYLITCEYVYMQYTYVCVCISGYQRRFVLKYLYPNFIFVMYVGHDRTAIHTHVCLIWCVRGWKERYGHGFRSRTEIVDMKLTFKYQ